MLAFAALAALVPALVAGQGSSAAVASAAASVPGCALTCTLQLAGSSACGGVTNITCLCTDTAFQSAVYQCYTNSCPESDRASAIAYGAQTCQSVGVTLDTTAVPSGVSTAAASGSTTAAPAASTTTAAAGSSSSSASSAASASPTGAAAPSVLRGNALVGLVGAIAGVAGVAALLL